MTTTPSPMNGPSSNGASPDSSPGGGPSRGGAGPSHSGPVVSRRLVLGGLGASVAALATGSYLRGGASASPTGRGPTSPTNDFTASVEPIGRVLPGTVDDRVLVVIDMRGGNDGLSLLAPVADGRYHDRRPSLAISEEEALWLDDEVGLHPALARLRERRFVTIEGVGPIDGDLSHFAMTERWERGDASGGFAPHTGFLGRLTDALDDGSPLVGVSMSGYTNHLTNAGAATLALDGVGDLWFFEPTDWSPAAAFRQGVQGFAGSSDAERQVIESYRRLMALSERLPTQDHEEDWEDPMFAEGGDLGNKLAGAAALIAADVGTRVVYVSFGDFDTHTGHGWKQQQNYQQLDAALDGFLRRVDDAGAAERVLVATVSEFGRRVAEHDGGLDHGAASTMLLTGAVSPQLAGERPDLDDLDDDGNLRTTVPFDRYLATLAEEWLGIEAASVLPATATPLGIL